MSALLAGTLHALSTHDAPTKDPARDRQPPSHALGVGRLGALQSEASLRRRTTRMAQHAWTACRDNAALPATRPRKTPPPYGAAGLQDFPHCGRSTDGWTPVSSG
jgi:hypothetical protein